MPFGVDSLLVVELLPGSESTIHEGLESSSGGISSSLAVNISLGNSGLEFSDGLGNCFLEEDTFAGLEIISSLLGGGVGNLGGSSLVSNSIDHDFSLLSNQSSILILEVSDLGHDVSIFAIVTSKFVSLGVSELPNKLLDSPLDFDSEGIDLGLKGESIGINSGDDGLFSGEKCSSLGVSEGIHTCVGGGFVGSESGFEGLSLGIDACLDGILFGIEDFELSGMLFWDTLHGPGTGTIDEPLLVVDVLDVNWVLSVGERLHMVFDSNAFLEPGVSGSSAGAP